MTSIVKLAPVGGIKFCHTALEDPTRNIEKVLNRLTDEENINQEDFRDILKYLSLSYLEVKRVRNTLALIYNEIKGDEEPALPVDSIYSSSKAEAKENTSEEEDDDDRTK